MARTEAAELLHFRAMKQANAMPHRRLLFSLATLGLRFRGPRTRNLTRIAAASLLLVAFAGAQTATPSEYKGLKAITLRNPAAQVVIVPAAGRIMAFQLRHADGSLGENPIWNNPQLGSSLAPDSEGWTNYGGDKTWPAPQADWPKVTGKGWPPPTGFDHMPFTATTSGATVTLTSPVDPSYGIRVKRVISLDAKRPVLHVATTYEKVQG